MALTRDDALVGLLDAPPSPLRYQYHSVEPHDVTGMLATRVEAGTRVLEVGCGTGSMLEVFRDRSGATAIGIEPDEQRAEMARSRGFEVVHGYYSEETAQRLGTFDAIVFADVIEHIVEPGPVLLLARRFLRPGGRLVLSVPNVAHWSIRYALLRGRFDYTPVGLMDATHVRWYTIDSLTRLLTATGFRIVDFDWTSGAFLPGYRRIPFTGDVARRDRMVRRLVRAKPAVFGFQHVVVANAAGDSTSAAA